MEESIRVAVGSKNPVKVGAVRSIVTEVFPNVHVAGYDVPSQVSAQPTTVEETTRGAIHRAQGALQIGQADLGFGLEAGVYFDAFDVCWLGGVVAVADSFGNVTYSQEFPLALPYEISLELRQGAELGPIIDRLSGIAESKKSIGAIGFLTNGIITREESWKSKIVYALTPLLQKDLYTEVRNRLKQSVQEIKF